MMLWVQWNIVWTLISSDPPVFLQLALILKTCLHLSISILLNLLITQQNQLQSLFIRVWKYYMLVFENKKTQFSLLLGIRYYDHIQNVHIQGYQNNIPNLLQFSLSLIHMCIVHMNIQSNYNTTQLTTGLWESQPIFTGGASVATLPFFLLPLANCAASNDRWNVSFDSSVGDAVPWRLCFYIFIVDMCVETER